MNSGRAFPACLLVACGFVSMINCSSKKAADKSLVHGGFTSFDSRESLEDSIPWVAEWWDVEADGSSFVVCLETPPTYGRSIQHVYAWRSEADGSFVEVWSFAALGVGLVEVSIDTELGSIAVIAKGNTAYKDATIAFVRLGATAD